MNQVFTSASLERTFAIAAEFSRQLLPGDFVALEGDLGAGKTQFVRGMVRGMGGDPRDVSSPTYVLLNIYPTPRLQVFHLDAYRMTSEQDMEAIGFAELLEQGGVVVVEWWQKIATLVPARRWTVKMEFVSPHKRRIEIQFPDPPAG